MYISLTGSCYSIVSYVCTLLQMPLYGSSVLHLAWSWGELHLLLHNYTSSYKPLNDVFTEVIPTTEVTPHTDLTLVHSYLTRGQWDKVFLHASETRADRQLCYHLVSTVTIIRDKTFLLTAVCSNIFLHTRFHS